MARIDKGALTKNEIVSEATRQFLEKGYTNTSIAAVAKGLEMSQGNLTFHYPTKEHLLMVLVEMLCEFQWKLMEEEANEGLSSVMALCLELATMAGASEDDAVIRDFFLASYTSPMCLDLIRKNDARRARVIFASYRPDWTDEQFASAEILVSGIEYATLMLGGDPVSLEARVSSALHEILAIYGVPEDVRNAKLAKVLSMDYRAIGKRTLTEFKKYVAKTNDKAFKALIKR